MLQIEAMDHVEMYKTEADIPKRKTKSSVKNVTSYLKKKQVHTV